MTDDWQEDLYKRAGGVVTTTINYFLCVFVYILYVEFWEEEDRPDV